MTEITDLPVRGRVHRTARPNPSLPAPAIRHGSPLLGDAPLSPAARREVLATVLSLPEPALDQLSPSEARVALDRLLSLAARLRHLQEEAAVDDLTGVLRRGTGLRLLQAEVDRVRRAGGRMVLVFADVDGLKQVNDSRGHLAGDRLLQLVAHTLRRRLRSYDLVMRYGGDEFVCVLSGAGLAEARAKLDAITAELRQRVGTEVLSVGLAELDSADPEDTAMALVGRADAALYRGRARRPERAGR
jgi:diguanylate cyclase (GGDEF)-like protein